MSEGFFDRLLSRARKLFGATDIEAPEPPQRNIERELDDELTQFRNEIERDLARSDSGIRQLEEAPLIQRSFTEQTEHYHTPMEEERTPFAISRTAICPTATPVIQTFEDITLADGSGIPAVLEVEMESTDWVAV